MKAKKKPKAFQCYLDNYPVLKHLSDSQAGRLWKMLYALAVEDARTESDDPLVSMAFEMMANKLERDFDAYREKVEINRQNAKKGGAPKGNRNAAKDKNNRTVEKTSETTQYKDKDEDKYKYKDEYEDEDKEETVSSPASAADEDFLSLFHRCCPSMPEVSRLTDQRRALIAEARRALGEEAEAYFRRAEASDFLSGRSGKWMGCTLDFLLRRDTIEKMRDGAYDNREAPAPAARIGEQTRSYDIRELEKIDTLDWIDR